MRDRPWSPAEIEAKIPLAVDRLHEAVDSLQSYGVTSATAEWEYREQLARCTVAAEGPNKESREAAAILALTEMHSTLPGWEQFHPGLARDLARNAYHDQRAVLAAITEDIGVMRSLLVSARKNEA